MGKDLANYGLSGKEKKNLLYGTLRIHRVLVNSVGDDKEQIGEAEQRGKA